LADKAIRDLKEGRCTELWNIKFNAGAGQSIRTSILMGFYCTYRPNALPLQFYFS
jgi:hypothetical protein